MSVCRTTRLSVCPSTNQSVTLSLHTTASLSVIPINPSNDLSVHHPVNLSLTCQSVTPPVSPVFCQSDCPSLSNHLYIILHCPSGCPTSSDHSSTIYTSLSDCLSLPNHLYDTPPSPSDHLLPPDCLYNAPTSPSACPSLSDSLTATMTRPPVHMSSHMINCTQDSSQSLAVVNGEQSHNATKFCRVFPNYDLLLHALDVPSLYLSVSRRVAPPKSGEDAHVTCGRCDLGGAILNTPRFGFSYVLPRLWDPGELKELLQPLQVQIHLEMPGILVQLGHIQRT